MNRYEREEISRLPAKYRPIGAWGYIGYNILFAIPFIGFICLVIFACSSGNICRRSFARSYFCVMFLVLLLLAIVVGIGIAAMGGFENFLLQIPVMV